MAGHEVRSRADVDSWCDRLVEACRARGVRLTHQRLAVFRALAEDPGHPSADQLYARLRPALRSLSLTTVYRILESFEREGLVRRVRTADGVARFDANLEPHQHLVCRVCGRIRDLRAAQRRLLEVPGRLPPGFAPERVEIHIVGRCRDCCASGRAACR